MTDRFSSVEGQRIQGGKRVVPQIMRLIGSYTLGTTLFMATVMKEEQSTVEAAQTQQETKEDTEKSTEDYWKMLMKLRSLPEEKILATLTDKEIERHERQGSMFVLYLALNSKTKSNLIETSADPESIYKDVIGNIVSEGKALRAKLAAASKLSQTEVLKKLQSHPYGSYFKQDKLPAADICWAQLSETQLRQILDCCLLEEQMREPGIIYNDSGEFWTTALPHGYNIKRQGTCQSIAAYYAAIASYADTQRFSTMRTLELDEHVQLCFDIGKDKQGRPVRFTRNTSFVDMSQVNADGTAKTAAYPYNHNFYDPQHDAEMYGTTLTDALQPSRALLATTVEYLHEVKITKAPIETLRRNRLLQEKALGINPSAPTTNANYIRNLYALQDKNDLTEEQTCALAGKALDRCIAAGYWAGVPLYNYAKRFGANRAAGYLQSYCDNISANPHRFSEFSRSPIRAMRQLPDVDRALREKENALSLEVRNRQLMFIGLADLSLTPEARKHVQAEILFLYAEMKTWKKSSK